MPENNPSNPEHGDAKMPSSPTHAMKPAHTGSPSPRDVIAPYTREEAMRTRSLKDYSEEAHGMAGMGGRSGIVRIEDELPKVQMGQQAGEGKQVGPAK